MLRIDELTSEERAIYNTLKPERLPEHVAIIMDGNGRWAGHRSLKRFLGHQQGAKSVQLVTETASSTPSNLMIILAPHIIRMPHLWHRTS